MASHLTGDKPLPKPMLTKISDVASPGHSELLMLIVIEMEAVNLQ